MNNNLFKNTILKVTLSIFNCIIPVIIIPYLYRVLGPTNMGIADFSESFHNYFLMFTSYSIHIYALRELSSLENNTQQFKARFNEIFKLGLLMSCITMIIYLIFIIIGFKNTIYFNPLIIFIISIVGHSFFIEWANEARGRYTFITLKTILLKIVYVLLIFIMVKERKDYLIYIILTATLFFFNAILSGGIILKDIGFKFKSKINYKDIGKIFIVIILMNINLILLQYDKIMLGSYTTPDQVAFYGLAQKIIILILSIFIATTQVIIPVLTKLYKKNDIEEYKMYTNKFLDIFCLIIIPLSIGLSILSKEIVMIFAGKEYLAYSNLLVLFSIYLVLFGFEYILLNNVLYIFKQEKIMLFIMLTTIIFKIISNSILIKLHMLNSYTAIITTILIMLIIIIITKYSVIFCVDLKIKLINLYRIKYIMISSLFIGINIVIKSIVNNYIITMILIIICSIALYLIGLALLKDPYFKFIKNKLKEYIKC